MGDTNSGPPKVGGVTGSTDPSASDVASSVPTPAEERPAVDPRAASASLQALEAGRSDQAAGAAGPHPPPTTPSPSVLTRTLSALIEKPPLATFEEVLALERARFFVVGLDEKVRTVDEGLREATFVGRVEPVVDGGAETNVLILIREFMTLGGERRIHVEERITCQGRDEVLSEGLYRARIDQKRDAPAWSESLTADIDQYLAGVRDRGGLSLVAGDGNEDGFPVAGALHAADLPVEVVGVDFYNDDIAEVTRGTGIPWYPRFFAQFEPSQKYRRVIVPNPSRALLGEDFDDDVERLLTTHRDETEFQWDSTVGLGIVSLEEGGEFVCETNDRDHAVALKLKLEASGYFEKVTIIQRTVGLFPGAWRETDNSIVVAERNGKASNGTPLDWVGKERFERFLRLYDDYQRTVNERDPALMYGPSLTMDKPVEAGSPIVQIADMDGEAAFELRVVMSREMHVAPSAHVHNLVKAHQGVRLSVQVGSESEIQEVKGVMDLLAMTLDRGTAVRWMATGAKAREVLNQIWLWNQREWPNVVPPQGEIPTVLLKGSSTVETAKEILSFMEVWETDMVSGVHDIEKGRMTLGDSKYGHEGIAESAGMGEAWKNGHITRIVFYRSKSTLTAHFPHLRIQDSDVGKVSLMTRFAPFFEGLRFSIDGGEVSLRAGALTRPPRPKGSLPTVAATEYPLYERLDATGNRREKIDEALSDLTRNPDEAVDRASFKALTPNERIELYLRLAEGLNDESSINPRPAVIVLASLATDLPFRERFELLRHVDVVFRDTDFQAKWNAVGLIEQFRKDFFRARLDYALYAAGTAVRDKTIVIDVETLFYGDSKGRESSKLGIRAGYEAYLEGLAEHNKLILYTRYPNRDILRMLTKHPILKRVFTGYRASEPKGRLSLLPKRGVITLQEHVRAVRRFLRKVELHPSKLTTAEQDYWAYLRLHPDQAISELHPVMMHQMGVNADIMIGSAPEGQESPAVPSTRVFEIPAEAKPTGVIWDLAQALNQEVEAAPRCLISRTRLPIGYPIEKEKVLLHFGTARKLHDGVSRALDHVVKEVHQDAVRRERKTKPPVPAARTPGADSGHGAAIDTLPMPSRIRRTGGSGEGESGGAGGGTRALAAGAEIYMIGNTATVIASDSEAIPVANTREPMGLLRRGAPRNDEGVLIHTLFARAIISAHRWGAGKTGTLLARLQQRVQDDPSALATLISPERLIGFLRKKGHQETARRLSESPRRLTAVERLVVLAAAASGEVSGVFGKLGLSVGPVVAPNPSVGIGTMSAVGVQGNSVLLNVLK